MSNLNFLHSGGNKVTLSAPDNNPSSDVNLKLPQADGSSGQAMVTNGSGALSFASVNQGLTLIETKEVASGSASATAFHFNNCFSSTYDFYIIKYEVRRTGTTGNGLYAQFGTAGNGSVITSNYYARGSMRYDRMGSSGNSGEFDLLSSAGYFQLCGTLSSPANAGFRGYMDIIDPQSAMVTIVGKGIMHNSSGNNSEKYLESFACSADDGERSGLTDFRLNMGNINSNGSDLTSTTGVAVYGRVSIFGAKQ